MPLFSTWIYLCEDGPRHLNEELEQLAHRLMQDPRNAGLRTNCGGWHYAFDLCDLEESVVAEFREEMEQHVQAFLDHFRPANHERRGACLPRSARPGGGDVRDSGDRLALGGLGHGHPLLAGHRPLAPV